MPDTVLMTATVRPNTDLFVTQSDPSLRLRQYQEAISSMRSSLRPETDLAIVETSGVGPSQLTALVAPQHRATIRVINFDAMNSDSTQGKGRIEADAVRHAVGVIAATAGTSSTTTVHKVTGRLVIENASEVFSSIDGPVVRARSTMDRSFVDTRVVSARIEEWMTVVLRDADAVDERAGVFLEHAVAAALARAAALHRIRLERFPVRPRIRGQSGSTGAAYRGGPPRAASNVTRMLERGLAGLAARKQI